MRFVNHLKIGIEDIPSNMIVDIEEHTFSSSLYRTPEMAVSYKHAPYMHTCIQQAEFNAPKCFSATTLLLFRKWPVAMAMQFDMQRTYTLTQQQTPK